MNAETWRKAAEFVGGLGIIAGLFMVAMEIRQANEIARTEVIIDLAGQYNEFNSARFQDPVVANLSLKLIQPGNYEISETDASMMAGAAWHFANILWSAQVAYDSGLISIEDLTFYRSHLEWMLDNMPGLLPEFESMFESNSAMKEVYVFGPLKKRFEQNAE